MKRVREPQIKRRRDAIHVSYKAMPALSATARMVFRLSPLDLIDGEVRETIAWDPVKCAPSARARMQELFDASIRWSELSKKSEAAWEYITRGPRGVKSLANLEEIFQNLTRRDLGLIWIVPCPIRLWMVDDDESELSSSESNNNDEEEEEEASSSSEEVSYGPMDAWLGKEKK